MPELTDDKGELTTTGALLLYGVSHAATIMFLCLLILWIITFKQSLHLLDNCNLVVDLLNTYNTLDIYKT